MTASFDGTTTGENLLACFAVREAILRTLFHILRHARLTINAIQARPQKYHSARHTH